MREAILRQELERTQIGGEREKIAGKDLAERLIEMQVTHQKEIKAMEEANMEAFIHVEMEGKEKTKQAQNAMKALKQNYEEEINDLQIEIGPSPPLNFARTSHARCD